MRRPRAGPAITGRVTMPSASPMAVVRARYVKSLMPDRSDMLGGGERLAAVLELIQDDAIEKHCDDQRGRGGGGDFDHGTADIEQAEPGEIPDGEGLPI